MGLRPHPAVLFPRRPPLALLQFDPEAATMKNVATIVLSLIAIVASLVLVLSTVCAFKGGFITGEKRPAYLICAIVALAIVVIAMWAIGRLNKKT